MTHSKYRDISEKWGKFPTITDLFSLHGRTALVTGAGGGIGSVIARALASAGADLVLCDIDKNSIELITDDIVGLGRHALPISVDLSQQKSILDCVDAAKETFATIDILINCAAINKRESIFEVAESTFDKIMAVNLRGLYQMSQTIASLMRQSGGGKIVNIGSLNSEMALSGVSVYGATKGAVKQLTMVMAVEWATYNIQVNCVIPGFMNTPLSRPVWKDERKSKWMRDRISLGRPGEPEELIGAIIYLASPASNYMTGQSIVVDGGVLAGGGSW